MTTQGESPPPHGDYASNGTVGLPLTPRPTTPLTGPGAGVSHDHQSARRRLSVSQWFRLTSLAIALIALGGAVGFIAATQLPTRYAAQADLLYTVTREQPTGFLRQDRNISTQLVMLQSRTVLGPVADEWDVSVDQLSAAVSASVVEESEVISVELTDRDPQRAEDMLGAVIDRYLEVSPNDARADLQDYLDRQLADVVSRINAIPSGVGDREGVLAPLVDREQWLRTRLDELELTDIAGPAAEVLVQPFVDSDPVSPRPALTTAAGATAGLIAAALVVAFLARWMTRPDVRRT